MVKPRVRGWGWARGREEDSRAAVTTVAIAGSATGSTLGSTLGWGGEDDRSGFAAADPSRGSRGGGDIGSSSLGEEVSPGSQW
ncbi:hypothetical protein, partial [Prochlorothrix hollandica]|uniref:hypothetical protein n=1 Tax=Prochlorothrix hollandica TaxID=1223 RepID=UPI003DA78D4A